MEIEQLIWDSDKKWKSIPGKNLSTHLENVDLVLIFGNKEAIEISNSISKFQKKYPAAIITGCITNGGIYSNKILEEGLVATLISFKSSSVKLFSSSIKNIENSEQEGVKIVNQIPQKNLKHIIILADGFKVNGSHLLKGIAAALPSGVNVTGGLSGASSNEELKSFIISNKTETQNITALCFYGNNLKIEYSFFGGWDPFGLERVITKSKNNIIYEIDGQPALDLVKNYLGDLSKDLPESALLLPFLVYPNSEQQMFGIVRSIIDINETDKSLTFAADIEQESRIKLMKGNFENLISGASSAAKKCNTPANSKKPELAFLVSCIGRKQLLGQRTEEEIEKVRDVFGSSTILSGFYSYGEICPLKETSSPLLHNQTMTITTISER